MAIRQISKERNSLFKQLPQMIEAKLRQFHGLLFPTLTHLKQRKNTNKHLQTIERKRKTKQLFSLFRVCKEPKNMRDSIYLLWINHGLKVMMVMMMFVSWRGVLGLENINPIFFDEGLSHLFGESNLIRSPDDRSVRLLLDKYTGNFLVFQVMI